MKKLLLLTLFLSLAFIKTQAQSWSDGYYSSGYFTDYVYPGGIYSNCSFTVDTYNCERNGLDCIYMSISIDIYTPDGEYSTFTEYGSPDGSITVDYPNNTLNLLNSPSVGEYSYIDINVLAIYEDGSPTHIYKPYEIIIY